MPATPAPAAPFQAEILEIARNANDAAWKNIGPRPPVFAFRAIQDLHFLKEAAGLASLAFAAVLTILLAQSTAFSTIAP